MPFPRSVTIFGSFVYHPVLGLQHGHLLSPLSRAPVSDTVLGGPSQENRNYAKYFKEDKFVWKITFVGVDGLTSKNGKM